MKKAKNTTKPQETWSQVVERRENRKVAQEVKIRASSSEKQSIGRKGTKGCQRTISTKSSGTKSEPGKKIGDKRKARIAAVVLTCPKRQYAATMAEIRNKIKLTEVRIVGYYPYGRHQGIDY